MNSDPLLCAVSAAVLQGHFQMNPDVPPTISQIQTGLKTTLDLLAGEQIRSAFELLSQIMDAISTHCEALGLSPDDSPVCQYNREEFWRAVNDTWIFAIQMCERLKEKDITGKNSLSEDDWIAVRDSVIAWGDVLEWYGLVDYELGFSEELVLDAIHLHIHNRKLIQAEKLRRST